MDGHPKKKNKSWRGNIYSETRYYVAIWLEKELPNVSGRVLNVASGGWPVPYTLLNQKNIKEYKTFDQKWYGDSKNKVDVRGDVHKMPDEWTGRWDCVICNQALECFEDPFKAMKEMYRVLAPGGVLLIDTPFNYRFFGDNTGLPKKKNKVKDYWRITRDGLDLLLTNAGFPKIKIEGFGGSGEWDRFVYCCKAIKK